MQGSAPFRRRFRGIASNVRAAIDLASIMVGVIVIGIIGGVISATVFAVIPWAQNEAAKQALQSVAVAESAYHLLGDGVWGTLEQLAAEPNSFVRRTDTLCIAATETGYTAIAASVAGTFFSITNSSPKPAESDQGAWDGCTGTAAPAPINYVDSITCGGTTYGYTAEERDRDPSTPTADGWSSVVSDIPSPGYRRIVWLDAIGNPMGNQTTPSEVMIYTDGSCNASWYNWSGNFQYEGLYVIKSFWPNGNPQTDMATYYSTGMTAWILNYYEDGTKESETFHTEFNVLYREDGPAHKVWWPNGQPRYEEWYLNGVEHREDGPSSTEWDEEGNVIDQRWE
ncbi:hypothetical protein ASF30_01980 [Leifsonia sp. Leaf264]|nr:hypothetical protein ASF30_01980 [Leifsonia sp. Leaf264]